MKKAGQNILYICNLNFLKLEVVRNYEQNRQSQVNGQFNPRKS